MRTSGVPSRSISSARDGRMALASRSASAPAAWRSAVAHYALVRRHHILTAYQLGVSYEALSYQFRVLDMVAHVANDTGHKDLPCGELDLLPDLPVMVMAGI